MQDTNLGITTEELQAMNNTAFFETKARIMKKISGSMENLLGEMEARRVSYRNYLPEEVLKIKGKVNRGENYLGFPYLVLDYPRIFHKEDVFAYRTMFWWGHFFSFTIHISGKYLFRDHLLSGLPDLQQEDLFVCVNESPWIYHFGMDNFIPSCDVTPTIWENQVINRGFIKLAITTELDLWPELAKNALGAFELFYKRAIPLSL